MIRKYTNKFIKITINLYMLRKIATGNPVSIMFMTPKTFARFSTASLATSEIDPIPLGYMTPKKRNERNKEISDMMT